MRSKRGFAPLITIILFVTALTGFILLGIARAEAQTNFAFLKTLRKGNSGAEVKKLQEILASTPGVYPEKLITGYFGALTRQAVQRFQVKYGLAFSGDESTTGYGLVGPKTRAKLNGLLDAVLGDQNSGTQKPKGTELGSVKPNLALCPDNIWDEAEQKDPNLCPADNPANNPESAASAPRVSTVQTPSKVSYADEPKVSAPVSIPAPLESSCVGFKISSADYSATANQIGAGWVTSMGAFRWDQLEPEKGVYDFQRLDEYVKKTQENNTVLMAEIQPYAVWDQGTDTSCEAKKGEFMCKPKDMAAYKKFLLGAIERYDGDGKSDMPGLKIPVKYWEFINEADIKNAPKVIFFKGTPGDYFDVLKISYETTKEACRECAVLLGAAAAAEDEFLSFWAGVLALGGANYFDIANVHYVGLDVGAGGSIVNLGDPATLNVKPYKAFLDGKGIKKPIWVSEAVLQSPNAKLWLAGALSAGASKVFFVGFGIDSPPVGKYADDYKGIADLCPKTP